MYVFQSMVYVEGEYFFPILYKAKSDVHRIDRTYVALQFTLGITLTTEILSRDRRCHVRRAAEFLRLIYTISISISSSSIISVGRLYVEYSRSHVLRLSLIIG